MALTVRTDTLTDISCVEDNGRVVELVRELLVTGITATDYRCLYEVLDDVGIPTVNSYPTDHPEMRLVKRSVAMLERDTKQARVRLEYIPYGMDELNFVLRGGTSLNQTETSFNRFGVQIVPYHTFPSDDPDFPSETIYRGGTANVLMPSTTLVGTGVLRSDWPVSISRRWVGSVNSHGWKTGNPGTWLCTSCTFDPHNLGVAPTQWRYTFEFQFKWDGWQPIVSFIDERTGKPPPNMVFNQGFGIVPWHPELYFGGLFP
jgi:hypothetical protein